MKFKMTKERVDTINELLKTHGDALTAFYDEAFHLGTIKGAIAGALVTSILSCTIVAHQMQGLFLFIDGKENW